jgi:hypothetical protein
MNVRVLDLKVQEGETFLYRFLVVVVVVLVIQMLKDVIAVKE